MTDEEENIAFNQWVKDWGSNFPNMPRKALYQVYRSMDKENRLEFLAEAKEVEKITEEEAREYAKKKYGLEDSWGMNIQESACMNGYIAGVKAHFVQWHILAENEKDLPQKNQNVKVLTDRGEVEYSQYFYDDYFEEWTFSNVSTKVIAWCEIPKESE